MSKNTNDVLLKNLAAVEKQKLVQRYLQSPFSLAWSKLATLLKVSLTPSPPDAVKNVAVQLRQTTAAAQFEQSELTPTQEQNLYLSFTDRVDPSLYYTIWHR